jgi:hypothetical protein
MSQKSIKSTLHSARVILSFGLLGAVIAGAFFGGLADIDLRPIGAGAGIVAGVLLKLTHLG